MYNQEEQKASYSAIIFYGSRTYGYKFSCSRSHLVMTPILVSRIQSKPTILYEDKHGAIALSKIPKSPSRTKQIGKRYHFISEIKKIKDN